MKTPLIPLSILAAVLGHAAESAPALVLPSVHEGVTNAASHLFASPQVVRRLYEAYARQNPADPNYHEQLAAALEHRRAQLSGILARQQQELTELKTQDPTPVAPAAAASAAATDPAESWPGAEPPPPSEPEPPRVPPTPPESPAVAAPARPTLPAAMEAAYHRLLIELESATPIRLKVHTNAPAAGTGQ